MSLRWYGRPRMVVLNSSAPVLDAARAIEQNRIGAVVVQDKGRVVGIVTDRDLAVRALARGLAPATTRIAEVMTPAPVVLAPGDAIADAIRLMHSIRQLGCRFALDDFGSGFASYAYLRQLPIDDVKIDGTFIRELAANREDQIFVKSITDIAHGMGKRVVAEFVENEEILRILGEIGVDYAQGYHIGRPAPLPAA